MTYDETIIRKWRIKARALRHDHSLSKRAICKMIADEYGLPLTTIRYYVFDSRRDMKEYERKYDFKYKGLVRHIDIILPKVFNSKPELPLNEISNGIDNLAGVNLNERTLEKILAKYENKPRGSPIIKTESGNYRLNDFFYNN